MPYADLRSPRAIESRRQCGKRNYYKHREAAIARAADWNRNHRERIGANAVLRRKRKPINFVLWWNARNRAKAAGIHFDLRMEDIAVPEICPVFGLKLEVADRHARANSPSLDRIDPAKGYTADNVQVISHKANTIKNNATLDEMRAVVRYMESRL